MHITRKDRYLLFIVATILLLIGGLLIGGEPIALPPIWVLGSPLLLLWAFFETLGPIARGQTTQLISSIGHFSIRHQDMHRIPWGRKYINKQEQDKESIVERTIRMTFAFTGGIEVNWWIPEPGKKEDPVFIFPSMFEGRLHNEYLSFATMIRKNIHDLSPKIKDLLEREYPHRVDEKTPIYFGLTSPLNQTSTEKNISLEDEAAASNHEANVMKQRLIKAYEELSRGKKAHENDIVIAEGRLKKTDED